METRIIDPLTAKIEEAKKLFEKRDEELYATYKKTKIYSIMNGLTKESIPDNLLKTATSFMKRV